MDLIIPDVLRSRAASVRAALARPLLAEWPEDEEYRDAEQPTAIADVLREALHTRLSTARIACLWRKEMRRGTVLQLAHATRASGRLRHLGQVDFVIEVNWTAWRALGPEARLALVDHELCHCDIGEGGGWAIRHHDVEEFGEVVRRWGLWHQDLRAFGEAVAHQLELFQASMVGEVGVGAEP